MDEIVSLLPRIVVGAAGLAVVYGLFRYKRKNDFNLWMQEQHRDMTRAASDEAFCREQFQETNAALSALDNENSASAITKRQEVVLRAYPRMMFFLGSMGAVMIFVAIASPRPTDGRDWPLYIGPLLLLASMVLYFFHRRERRGFVRVQLLNRKYLLQKTLNDDGMFETMRELLHYYPNLVPLWVEMAHQYADRGDMAAAYGVLRDAEGLMPGNLDLAVTEIAFHLRQNDIKAAENKLKTAETLPRQATDPRVSLYYGAIALAKGDKAEAKRRVEEALGLDSRFVLRTIPETEAFSELKTLIESEKIAEFEA